MTIPGLEKAEVPPQGELGMAGVLPDALRYYRIGIKSTRLLEKSIASVSKFVNRKVS